MDDLDGSNDMGENFVYNDGIPYEENILQINTDLGYSHWTLCNLLLLSQNYLCEKWLENIIICLVLLFGTLCMFMVLKHGTCKFEIWYLVVIDLLPFISFYVKIYLFFNDSLAYIMNYNYWYIFLIFYLWKLESYDLRFKFTIRFTKLAQQFKAEFWKPCL